MLVFLDYILFIFFSSAHEESQIVLSIRFFTYRVTTDEALPGERARLRIDVAPQTANTLKGRHANIFHTCARCLSLVLQAVLPPRRRAGADDTEALVAGLQELLVEYGT